MEFGAKLKNPALYARDFESLDDIEDMFRTGGLPKPKVALASKTESTKLEMKSN